MTGLRQALLVGLVMAVAACTSPERFDNEVDLNNTNPYGDAGETASPTYFQQAVGDRVLFEVDQSTLNDEARRVLSSQAGWLTEYSDYNAVIEGHADEQGTREYNLALGARRANSVREYLVSQGVAGNRLRTVSFGKERPIEICSDENCYEKNRRSVTVLRTGLNG